MIVCPAARAFDAEDQHVALGEFAAAMAAADFG